MSAPPRAADPPQAHGATIELRVSELKQLFNAMDPAPFRERDLDPRAEKFIVECAREVRSDAPLDLVVQLDRQAGTPEEAAVLQQAVSEFFRDRALATRRRLRHLLRIGRISLAIGLGFLAASILLGDLVSGLGRSGRMGGVLQESLLIGGWVVMWRPIEIFLRLVADPRRGEALRSSRRDARSPRSYGRGRHSSHGMTVSSSAGTPLMPRRNAEIVS